MMKLLYKNCALINNFLLSALALSSTFAHAVTLQEILLTSKSQASVSQWQNINEDKTRAEISAGSKTLGGAISLGLKGQVNSEENKNVSYETILRQKLLFGNDRQTATSKYQNTNNAEYLEKLSDLLGQEISISKIYAELRQKKELKIVLRKANAFLKPNLANAKKAVNNGTVTSLFQIKLQIYGDTLQSEFAQLTNEINSLSTAVKSCTQSPVDLTDESIVLAPIDPRDFKADMNDTELVAVKKSMYKKNALVAQTSLLSSTTELDVGAGVAYDADKKERSYVVEVGIPLGTRFAISSQVSALQKEKDALEVESDMVLKNAALQKSLLRNNVAKNQTIVQTALRNSERIEEVLIKIRVAFNRGNQDVYEYLDFYKEAIESRRKYLEARAEYEKSILELHYFLVAGVR